MPDLSAALRLFVETLAGEIIAVTLGLLLAAAFAVNLGVGCRLYARMVR
jgi:F0F1-type ATP synthase membrane subunit a